MEEKEVVSPAAIRGVIKDYLGIYRKHPWYAVIGFLLPAIGNIFVYFVPPLILAQMINVFAASGTISFHAVELYLILFGGLWLFGEVLWRIGQHFIIALFAKAINTLAKDAFRKLVERDYTFYTDNFVGSLTKKALVYSGNFDPFTNNLNSSVIGNVFPIIFAVVVLWRYSPLIPLVLVVSIFIAVLLAYPIIRRRSKLVSLRHDASSKMAGRLSDSTTNMLTVKSFATEEQEYATYGDFVDTYTDRWRIAADYQNKRLDIVLSPLYVITNVIGLILAIYFAEHGNLHAGAIVVVFSYYSQISRIFWEINNVYRGMESSITEAAEFVQLFLDPPAVEDVPGAVTLTLADTAIRFNDVTFNYGEDTKRESFALQNFDLDIKNNQRIGLVGPSGGGKTTITKLLLRFIDLDAGSITIGGQDISAVTQSSLREAIAYVPQEPLLFHRSLRENIAYGNENASEEDILQASKLAHADEFISKLPRGYETMVGERGIKLSGGQRQRVAIARALLKAAPILVLDEATSSLDSESEKYIQDGLWELMKGRTALVIAHRLSTIKHLDRIIVLDQGAIVQDGTHDDLIRQPGLYAKLWSHQSGEFLED